MAGFFKLEIEEFCCCSLTQNHFSIYFISQSKFENASKLYYILNEFNTLFYFLRLINAPFPI